MANKKVIIDNRMRQIEKQKLQNMGYEIIDNTKIVADAERQCVNARIQGSAATQTKIAQVQIFNNEEFRRLGGKIILQVHDKFCRE